MNKLVEVARKYIGQTEKPGNAGFNDPEFEAKMKAVGFEKGHSWCSYFVELCLKEAYPEKVNIFNKLCSANANKTLDNFQDMGYPIGNVPIAGYVVVWVQMKEGKEVYQVWNGQRWYHGHIGIVSSVEPNNWIFKSIEGNTNASGSREGDGVAEKTRKHLADVRDGLKIVGFFNPAIAIEYYSIPV